MISEIFRTIVCKTKKVSAQEEISTSFDHSNFVQISAEKRDEEGEQHNTIDECLEQYFNGPEEEKTKIWIAPKVLIIHVQLVYFDKKEKKLKKFKKQIKATKELDIRQHSDNQLKKYNLCGMIEHIGGAA